MGRWAGEETERAGSAARRGGWDALRGGRRRGQGARRVLGRKRTEKCCGGNEIFDAGQVGCLLSREESGMRVFESDLFALGRRKGKTVATVILSRAKDP